VLVDGTLPVLVNEVLPRPRLVNLISYFTMTEPAAYPARLTFGMAVVDSLPLLPAYVLWAMIFGAAATVSGFGAIQAVAMSVLVFSGTAQLAALKIAALPLASIFLTSVLLSLRFLPMTLALNQRLDRPRWQRAVLAWMLVDGTFALATGRRGTNAGLPSYLAGAFVAAYCTWVAATVAGALAGPLVPRAWAAAADALVVVIFVVLTAELCITIRVGAAAIGAGVAALLLSRVMPAGAAMLVAAVAVSAALSFSEGRRQ
jgi:predicted branched-subunit amino acid permease